MYGLGGGVCVWVGGGGDIFDDISFWGRSGERWEGARIFFLSGGGGRR